MPEKYLNLVGSNINKFRTELRWTQDRLALQLQILGWDLSRSGVGKIESRLVRVADFELFYLAAALGVEVLDLIPSVKVGKDVHEIIERKRRKNLTDPISPNPYKRVDRL